MGADSAFFVYGLLGLFAGYIIGDVQRELRWRRDARANLRLAVDRTPGPDSDADRSGAGRSDSRADGDSDADSGPAWALGSVRDGQARRRAVSRPQFGAGPAAPVRGRGVRRADAAPVGAGYDCG